ncbi:hypothetical protein ColKHC_12390 [Colletotrichum higginsianum]|nr:hypothetical protein ColKHC_12390 [Colletotrichum higginsianum]
MQILTLFAAFVAISLAAPVSQIKREPQRGGVSSYHDLDKREPQRGGVSSYHDLDKREASRPGVGY